jgi:predicted double-glycine peptidase
LGIAVTNQNMIAEENYNFACGSAWVQNLISDIKVGT